jgi:hypothetical protein
MYQGLRVDLNILRGIHLFGLCAILFCACESKEKAPVDASVVPLTESEVKSIEKAPPEDGIKESGEGEVVQAVGKALKGMDVSLARQSASNRARANIAKVLKDKGYALDPPGVLNGVTIERIWTEGRYVYALGVLPLSKLTKPVNDPNSAPSNSEEGDKPVNSNSTKQGEEP